MKKKSKKYAAVAFGIILTVCVLTGCTGIFAGGLSGSNGGSGNVEEPVVEEGVYVEKAELPFYKNEAGQYVAIDEQYEHAMVDWEGMFVYQGRLYKRSSLNYVEKKKAVGEHLGTATGDTGDDVEFSGNIVGEVYSVNGVDPSFMLYVKQKNGSEFLYISGNDLVLETGADLYEELLHLKGNIDFAYCQEKKQEWRKEKECHYEFFRQKLPEELLEGLELEDFDSFISVLCKSPFVYTNECPFEINYDKPKQTGGLDVSHMTISTKSGVHLDLILVEGGYVVMGEAICGPGLSGLGSVFVKMDEAEFNKLFDKIKKSKKK